MSAATTAIEKQSKRELVVCTAPDKPGEQELLRAISRRMAARGHYCRLQVNSGKISLVAA
ncbi:MAG: hypothetical protein NTX82_00960 [Candidatus Parcubacteria bacterium]|nr:hypothetical protein [Candidatus Parcubacteria bacterium]